MAATRTALVELVWKVHPHIYRWTRGRLGGRMMNMPVLLLTTTGRRTGDRRTKALMYLPDGPNYVVIASYLGEDRHPAWYLNLQANPRAEVLVGDRRVAVTAHDADGDERTRLWDAVVQRQPDYAEYQRRTARHIPVVVLEPAA
jgi:deazaflavin-dependent oxidoreductase (nitroreductase family)